MVAIRPGLSFGALLKQFRRAAELSQEQLGERAGYSAVYIRKLEGGDRRPIASTIELLAQALGLDAGELALLQEAAQRSTNSATESLAAGRVLPAEPVQATDIHTFLIADIRGYTQFTQAHGDEAAARLTGLFAGVARDLVAEYDGEVIELRGDEVLAVFSSARAAVRAALALRDKGRQISTEDPTLPLRIGIGLDAGEAVPVEGGYRGSALNLAARLCSLAGPEEVFVSETIMGLARKIDAVAYRERGRVQLKGFSEPISVVQVLLEGEVEVPPHRETFDALLVTGAAAGETAERIAVALQTGGLKLRIAGEEPEELAAALRMTGCALVFVGPNGVDASLHDSLTAALDPLDEEWQPRVLLVLLPGVADPFDPATLPPYLSTRIWVDLRGRMVDDPEATERLVGAIAAPNAGDRPRTARSDEPPYRGLDAFDEANAEFFFGRQGDVQRLIERLKANNFLAVLGPSGSGKSSLVKAGLVPALRSGVLLGSENWTVRTFTPGAQPLTTLAVQLLRLYPGDSMQATLDGMAQDSRTFHLATLLALAGRPHEPRIVWIVDQFEELFTLCRDDAERRGFLANLLHAATAPDGRTIVVLTMRADFYHHAAQYPDLGARIAAEQYLVGPMRREALRQVIEEPAWRVGLEFGQGLVDRILEDVADQPGALPLLEYALLDLWQGREGHILTLERYRKSGGVQGAIAQRAERTLGRFSPEEQAITRRILLRLTQTGEGAADTRRRTSMTELVTQSGSSQIVERVINALVGARLLTASRAEPGEERQVEVAHEALIRGWPRLRQWIDEDRSGLRTHRRLTEAAQEWLRLGRDDSMLQRGATLATALEWAQRNPDALNELEKEFLAAGVDAEAAERRQARRRIWLAVGGLLAALFIVSGAAAYALAQQQQAVRDRDAALSVLWAQRAASLQALGLRTPAILVAVEAVRRSQTPPAVHALRDALARFPVAHILQGHTDSVVSAFYRPDSRQIVTASSDGTAMVWDAASGRRVTVLKPGAGPLNEASFSPDGRKIVTAMRNGMAGIWDANSGRRLALLCCHRGAVKSAAFSPDGRWIATAGVDRTARLWDQTRSKRKPL